MTYPEFNVSVPVIFGCGASKILGERLLALNCSRALIICDKGVAHTGLLAQITETLKASGIEAFAFTEVTSDPLHTTVDEASTFAKSVNADCLVGIGGGSSMDVAKATAIALELNKPAVTFVLPQPITVPVKTPVVLLPTTAGTGSEVTAVAIISVPEKNGKWSVFTNTSLAILDPELTLSLPAVITANTGLDALSHAMEAMTTNQHNVHSDLFAKAAIEKITTWLPIAVREPQNLEARSEMMLASNWAGFAFNNPITHVGHAIADALSVKYHTPHGYNCALALPAAIAFVASALPEQLAQIASAMGLSRQAVYELKAHNELGEAVSDMIRQLINEVQLLPLTSVAPNREEVIALAPDVIANHLCSFSPIPVTLKDAERLLGIIYDK
jgi:alcohol dehydrogenase class IV